MRPGSRRPRQARRRLSRAPGATAGSACRRCGATRSGAAECKARPIRSARGPTRSPRPKALWRMRRQPRGRNLRTAPPCSGQNPRRRSGKRCCARPHARRRRRRRPRVPRPGNTGSTRSASSVRPNSRRVCWRRRSARRAGWSDSARGPRSGCSCAGPGRCARAASCPTRRGSKCSTACWRTICRRATRCSPCWPIRRRGTA